MRIPTLTHFRVRALEWVVGAMLLLWFFVLVQPRDILHSSQSYTVLAKMLNQTAWAYVCLFVGGVRLIALYINGAWSPTPWIRIATSILSSYFWLWLTIGIYASGYLTPGFTVYPVLFLCDLYSVGRAAKDARLTREALAQKPEAPVVYTFK